MNGNVLQTVYFDFLVPLSVSSENACLVSSSPRPDVTAIYDIRRAELMNLTEIEHAKYAQDVLENSPKSPRERSGTNSPSSVRTVGVLECRP